MTTNPFLVLAIAAGFIGTLTSSSKQIRSGLDMVRVDGGGFTMGGTDEADDGGPPGARLADECPHPVAVHAFSIARYEVTQADWLDVMGILPPDATPCDDCPVNFVSWNDVQTFIDRLNQKTGEQYRLPTEEEWEFAARGGLLGRGLTYAGSDRAEEVAWFDQNAGGEPHPVGLLDPNELGLYDMSGNIWEWTATEKAPYPCDLFGKTLNVPVLRGGTFASRAASVRVRDRNGRDPDTRLRTLGFRLAL